MKIKLIFSEFQKRLFAHDAAFKYQSKSEITRLYQEDHPLAYANDGELLPQELRASERDPVKPPNGMKSKGRVVLALVVGAAVFLTFYVWKSQPQKIDYFELKRKFAKEELDDADSRRRGRQLYISGDASSVPAEVITAVSAVHSRLPEIISDGVVTDKISINAKDKRVVQGIRLTWLTPLEVMNVKSVDFGGRKSGPFGPPPGLELYEKLVATSGQFKQYNLTNPTPHLRAYAKHGYAWDAQFYIGDEILPLSGVKCVITPDELVAP